MPLCDWLCKCCCCTRPCSSSCSSPTTPTSADPHHRTNGQHRHRHRCRQQQEGQVIAHMHQQQNNATIEVVSNLQPRRSITNAAGGEMGEIHVSCHSAIYDCVGENLPSPVQQQHSAGGRNGRKISPLGQDNHQHAVVKERAGDTAVITFSTRMLAPDMIKVPLTPMCTPNGSSWDSAANASSCGPRRCPNFISVQSIQESFQKFADFCSTAFNGGGSGGNAADSSGKPGDARSHLMPYHIVVHKFSLEQRSDLVESEAALAKRYASRATKSLPSTARPPIEYFQMGEQQLLGKLIPKLTLAEDADAGDDCEDNGGMTTASTTRSTTSSADTLISAEKEHTEETEGLWCASDTATPSAVSVESSSSPGPPKSFFEMLGGYY